LGLVHARQRLGIENEHHHEVFSRSGKFFHLENWYSVHAFIRYCVRVVGLHERGQSNTTRIELRHNQFSLPHLPDTFDGFRILHLSDLHVDMYPPATHALIEVLREVDYDLCVMTGDYRARTFGDIDASMKTLASIRSHLRGDVYAVLGNHDSIRMVPAMEDMGISLLLNENTLIEREQQSVYLAGIDDAHFFHVDNIEKAMANGLENSGNESSVKILLSHTPEVFRQATHAGVDIFLCGHTHGGQICLPGEIPVTLDSRIPRTLAKGAWAYRGMQGYTSVGAGTSIVNIRFNCPPEITVHTLKKADR
jgi:uncharacterized protein